MSEAIAAINKRFMAASEAGDGAAVAALYTDDASFLPPHCPAIVGPQAIAEFAQEIFDAGVAKIELRSIDVEEHGDVAFEEGRYRLVAADGDLVDEGKYVVIWKRTDGTWKLHKDIFNSDHPTE